MLKVRTSQRLAKHREPLPKADAACSTFSFFFLEPSHFGRDHQLRIATHKRNTCVWGIFFISLISVVCLALYMQYFDVYGMLEPKRNSNQHATRFSQTLWTCQAKQIAFNAIFVELTNNLRNTFA